MFSRIDRLQGAGAPSDDGVPPSDSSAPAGKNPDGASAPGGERREEAVGGGGKSGGGRAPISFEAIRERAYELWERHHRPDGFEVELWLMAERELRAEAERRPAAPPKDGAG